MRELKRLQWKIGKGRAHIVSEFDRQADDLYHMRPSAFIIEVTCRYFPEPQSVTKLFR